MSVDTTGREEEVFSVCPKRKKKPHTFITILVLFLSFIYVANIAYKDVSKRHIDVA